MRPRCVEQIIGLNVAAHDPLIVRSLNRFSVANYLALVRGGSFFDTTRTKEHTTAKERRCRRGGSGSNRADSLNTGWVKVSVPFPAFAVAAQIDESKWSGA